jgi:hypothetical protein
MPNVSVYSPPLATRAWLGRWSTVPHLRHRHTSPSRLSLDPSRPIEGQESSRHTCDDEEVQRYEYSVWKRVASLTAVAALMAGVTTTASAQARPTSQQRIPVQKESAGEVARRDSAARADSIAAVEAARRDSIARAEAAARQDSITKAEMARRDSMARADSIAKAAAAAAAVEAARRDSIAREDSIRNAQAALAKRGFVFGLAGGYSATSGTVG